MDDQAYLEPGFDPSTLTVPKLRSILVAHNVNYPSSAKKPELIAIFEANVASQARKLQAASARIKRTSRGIEDITTGRRGTGAGDDDQEEVAVPRSSRRSTRARTEEAMEVAPTPRSTRYSTAPPESSKKRSTSKHARTETVEEEPEPASKRSTSRRTTATTPRMKAEAADEESPFSDVNVFQSGGSPPASRNQDTDRRRTTTSAATRDLERRNRELRRQTDQPKPIRAQAGNALVPSRKTFEFPVPRANREEIEPTEEFTPEGQLEVAQAQQAGELVPVRPKARRPTAGVPQAFGTIFLAVLMGMLTMLNVEKFKVGYCGVGQPSVDFVPAWAEFLRPQCAPCPPHAFCHEKLQTECEDGFVLQHHPLSLSGNIAIPPTCEPDSVKARKIDAVTQRTVEELRKLNAKYECGEISSPSIKEVELKEAISTMRRKGLTDEEFDDIFAHVIPKVDKLDEVVSGSDGTGYATLRSTSLAAIPLTCAVRRSIRETIGRYLWHLVGLVLLLGSGSYGRYRITSGSETETKAKQLASLALEKLSYQAALHAQEPEIYRENYVSVAQLRDDVLRDEFSTARRKKLWEKVQRKVEGNSNVRPMVREGRTGDVGRVWEWVGAIGLLESPPQSGERRKSGRVSFIEPSSEVDVSGGNSSMMEVGERKKWQENRTYY